MKHAIIKNLPKNVKKLFDEALDKSFNSWIDEKGTKDNPGIARRQDSKLTYKEAFNMIKDSKPHWVISFRNMEYLTGEADYWEFGGCSIGSNDYGEVFIWIRVDVESAEEIFKKYKLEIYAY